MNRNRVDETPGDPYVKVLDIPVTGVAYMTVRGGLDRSLTSVKRLLPAPSDVALEKLPDTLIEIGCVQAELNALQSALVTRALTARREELAAEVERRLSMEEVAPMIGFSTSWIQKNWRKKLPFGFRDGGKLFFRSSDVQKYLRSRGR